MEAIIETRELTRTFDLLVAVDRLTLSVNRGEIFGLRGPGRRRQDDHPAAACAA